MQFYDSHCHLDSPQFDEDRTDIITQLDEQQISGLMIPATTRASWEKIHHICAVNPNLHAAYGLHPMFMSQHKPSHIIELHEWLKTHPSQAIGECGLDFFHGDEDAQAQTKLFEEQLGLAEKEKLPLIIHARKALDQIIHTLKQCTEITGVIHSFSGSIQQAEQLIELGFKLGIGGTVTFERAQRLHRVIKHVGLANLLLETDSPDQPDQAWRGRRNEPKRLTYIAQVVAEKLEVPVHEVARHTTQNSQAMFKFS